MIALQGQREDTEKISLSQAAAVFFLFLAIGVSRLTCSGNAQEKPA
jgi:hypothetical protein